MATADKTFRILVAAPSGGGGAPSYISSMSPYQVRALSGSYAPSNGSTSLLSVMPGMWGSDTDIMRPWSGGAKSMSGTKLFVHGGGHNDSANNGLYSFDYAGTTRPVGWAVENQGQTGVTSDISVGATGSPRAVHTYDGMVDMGTTLYRIGGSQHPNGFMTSVCVRYDKSAGTWTRIPDYSGGFGGCALAGIAAGKVLAMERWASYFTYAFYRVATNNWSSTKSGGSQWPSDGASAFDPATNTGLTLAGDAAYSIGINWSAETVTQTPRSLTSMGSGAALIWDATASRYWCFGGASNNSTIYEINPTTFAVTPHTLTGNAPLSPEGGSTGHWGRWVFMESWRAIGTVSSRTGSACVIRLP